MNKMAASFSALKGRRATLYGLQKKPELNGIPGTIGEFLPGKGRVEFFPDHHHVEKYAGGMARMEVRTENVTVLPEGTQEVVNISGALEYSSGGRDSENLLWMGFKSAGDMQYGRGEILDAVRNALGVSRKVIDKTDSIAKACRGLEHLGKMLKFICCVLARRC